MRKVEPTLFNVIIGLMLTGIVIVTFTLAILNFSFITATVTFLIGLLLPFIIGFVLAFLMSPLQNYIEKKMLSQLALSAKHKRLIATITALLFTLSVLIVVFISITPQLLSSINTLIDQIPGYFEATTTFINHLIFRFNIEPEVATLLQEVSQSLITNINTIARNVLSRVLALSIDVLTFLFRFGVGIIIAIYMLLEKERFVNQVSKFILATTSTENAHLIFKVSNLVKEKFNQFIFGITIDSLIVGVISFIAMSLFQWPYALLISVILSITNMIPVFGPFIGAIPGFFILFIVSPSTALWFVVFVILLQQLDGNVIAPNIIGNSVGLPTLWIMFAIIIGGGLFGVLGMFLSVPMFAVIYVIIKEVIAIKLEHKGIK